jgi:ABC-type multidrug transport system ATPase subunit
MTLLALERVGKRYKAGRLERVVLDEVSLSLEAGELVAVWGMPRSGRSTLLRIAAGIEPPDTGFVRFEGRDLNTPGRQVLGNGIGYCRPAPRDREAGVVLDELMLGPRARGASNSAAGARAHAALERVGASDCAEHPINELDGAEAVRVNIARALLLDPAVLIIDEPVTGVDLLHRDDLLALLRSLADDDGIARAGEGALTRGIAVLMTVSESTALAGCDRALRIGGGGLGGSTEPELAAVVPIHREASA